MNINVQEEQSGYLQCWNLNGISRSSLDDKFWNRTTLFAVELKIVLSLEATVVNRDLLYRDVPARIKKNLSPSNIMVGIWVWIEERR